MLMNKNRKFKLGMHSYCLNLFGCCEFFGEGSHEEEKIMHIEDMFQFAKEVGLDVLHITLQDLDNNTDPEFLANVKKMSEEMEIGLELNASFNAPYDSRVNICVKDALELAHAIGASLVKYSLDIKRPRKVTHSKMCPEVMKQLAERAIEIKENLPLMEEYGLKIAVENHTDTFAEEVVWVIEQVSHPDVGACCDTINSLVVGEGIEESVRILAPYTICMHFCDNNIVPDWDGTHSLGTVIGEGMVDCVKIMQIMRSVAPPGLDTINFEIELPHSISKIEEGGREKQIQGIKDSIKYMKEVLKVGKDVTF